jgi:hypothetical protein
MVPGKVGLWEGTNLALPPQRKGLGEGEHYARNRRGPVRSA